MANTNTTKKYVSLDKLGKYDEKIKAYLATADAKVLDDAKGYADGLAGNYDAAGAAATAETNAKAYTDTEVAKANESAAAAKTQADKGVNDAAAAQSAADKAQGEVDALEAYVGTIPGGYSETNVIAYINKKAQETLSSATGGSSESAASVLEALNTYKAENDPKVTANATAAAAAKTAADNAQAAADGAQSYAEGVASNLATETTNRTNADDALGERIATLEGKITGLTGAMHFVGVKENVPEGDFSGYSTGDVITVGEKEYVFNGTAFVEFGDVSSEGQRISTLESWKTTASADIDKAKGDITTINSTLSTKVSQETYDAKVTELAQADTDLGGRIDALETAVGSSGSVATDIATAKQEAIDAAATDATTKANTALADAKKYADDEDAKIETRVDALEAASATHATSADLETAKGRITTAEGEIDTLQTEMDAVEALAQSNKTATETNAANIATKASQTDLDTANANIATNASAIAAFVECSEEEINALFVTSQG